MAKCNTKGLPLVVVRISACADGAISPVRGRRLCDRSGRICIGQGILATPGCGGISKPWTASFGLEVWLFLSSCQELGKDREAP